MRNFHNYRAYFAALDFGVAVLKTTAQFPDTERYELTSQLRRSAVSVPSARETQPISSSKHRTHDSS